MNTFTITVEYLKKMNACKAQRDIFSDLFPNGFAFPVDPNHIPYTGDLDIGWAAFHLLNPEALHTYKDAVASADTVAYYLYRTVRLEAFCRVVNDWLSRNENPFLSE